MYVPSVTESGQLFPSNMSKLSSVQIMMLRSMTVETCQGSTAAMQESPTHIQPAPIARADSLVVSQNTGDKHNICVLLHACSLSAR